MLPLLQATLSAWKWTSIYDYRALVYWASNIPLLFNYFNSERD